MAQEKATQGQIIKALNRLNPGQKLQLALSVKTLTASPGWEPDFYCMGRTVLSLQNKGYRAVRWGKKAEIYPLEQQQVIQWGPLRNGRTRSKCRRFEICAFGEQLQVRHKGEIIRTALDIEDAKVICQRFEDETINP